MAGTPGYTSPDPRKPLNRHDHPAPAPGTRVAKNTVKQGKVPEAVGELKRALEIEPNYVAARREFHRLLGMLN